MLDGMVAPLRRWLVPDWVPMARVTALYGAGGEGKTLLAQMLATACALGRDWLGVPTSHARSILLFCEDDVDEMHRRQEDINRHYGCSFADLKAMRWLPRLGDDNALMTFGTGRPALTPLFYQLSNAARDHQAKLIVGDTLADVFSGNENDRGQARAFAQQALGFLARETQGAVVALAHPSRAGMNSGSGESGSTAWIGTFRSQLYLSTPKSDEGEPTDPNLRLLTRKKSNAARRDETIELRWQDGVFVAEHVATGIIASPDCAVVMSSGRSTVCARLVSSADALKPRWPLTLLPPLLRPSKSALPMRWPQMADRAGLLAEHTELRRQRGVAAADGLPFNGLRLVEIEAALDVAEDVEGEQRRRELAADAEARQAFVAARRHEIVVADAERIAALDAAESGCRTLAEAIRRYLAAHQALAASGARLGLDVPIPISGNSPAIMLSQLIGETLREVAPEGGHIGNLELPRWPAVERPVTWRAADAAADAAVKHLLETPSPVIQGEHQ